MAKVQLTKGKTAAKPVLKKPVREESKASKDKRPTAGLSLRQLLKATPPYIHNNAGDVILRTLKETVTKGGFPAVQGKAMSITNKQRTEYKLSVIGKDREAPIYKQKHVLVSCSCDFFTFYSEYALTQWGSAVIKYSNGEPAVTTNPGNVPLVCKHLVKLIKTIIEEQV